MEDRPLGSSRDHRLTSAVDAYVGRQVRLNRTAQGLSSVSVAESLGVDVSLLTLWEAGYERIPPSYLLKLSKALSCSITSFFEGLQEALQLSEGHDATDGELANLLSRYSAPKH